MITLIILAVKSDPAPNPRPGLSSLLLRIDVARRRVFYGWWIAGALTLLLTYGSGVFFNGFGVFFKPIAGDFGWSRAETALAFALSRLEGGLEGPIAGWLIDRFGPRRLVVFGVLSVGFGYILLSQIHSLWMFYIVYGGFLSIGFNTGFFSPSQAATVTWFRRRRGAAVGMVMTSVGLGGALVVPIMAWLVEGHGWRGASLAAGCGMLVLGLPLTFIIRRRPEDHGLRPDGDPAPQANNLVCAEPGQPASRRPIATPAAEIEPEFTLKQAVRTSAFWVITFFMMTRLFAANAVLVHMIPYLSDIGHSPQEAANWAAYAAFVSVPCRFGAGWLSDLLDKRYMLTTVMLAQCVSAFLLATATGDLMIAIALTLWGIGDASAPLHTALRADYFGRKHYALISGCMSPFIMLGSFAGPVFAGYIFDVTASYSNALMLIAVSFLISSITVLFARRPHYTSSSASATAQ